jgi:hypothetical protein
MHTRLLIASFFALVLAPLAHADGLPIADTSAPATVGGGNGNGRLVALPTAHGTAVARLGEVVYASTRLDGRYTVPVVALDHTAAGLSTDGSTLVLINPRRTFPRARTSFVVLDATSLRTRSRIVLEGDFSFDALSPDGTRVFLIHYLSRRDPTRYEVRALDVPSGRLLPTPIVDKSEPDERMAGLPITRETSAEMLAGRQDLYDLRLGQGPRHSGLAVLDGAEKLTVIDTVSFESAKVVPDAVSTAESSSLRWPIGLLTGVVLVVLVGGVLALRRRRYSWRSSVSSGPRT